MSEKMRWACEEYRGMYIHVITFEMVQGDGTIPQLGRMWGYLLAVRATADFDEEMICGPACDDSDYFARDAAKQAAAHYGKRTIDILRDVG